MIYFKAGENKVLNARKILECIDKQDKMLLYHGSRGGIEGDIRPISRERCDFGKGFYMGTNAEQAKGLVVEDASPVFYTVEVDFLKIQKDKVLFLDDKEWLYTILAFRKKSEEFSRLSIAKECIDKVNSYDIVIGAIADDRMNEAIKSFTDYSLTDKAFTACLKYIDFGYEVVAKTENACEAIKVISSRDIFGKEADDIHKYTMEKRKEAMNVVTEMRKKYQREGMFLNELIEAELKRDIKQEIKQEQYEKEER